MPKTLDKDPRLMTLKELEAFEKEYAKRYEDEWNAQKGVKSRLPGRPQARDEDIKIRGPGDPIKRGPPRPLPQIGELSPHEQAMLMELGKRRGHDQGAARAAGKIGAAGQGLPGEGPTYRGQQHKGLGEVTGHWVDPSGRVRPQHDLTPIGPPREHKESFNVPGLGGRPAPQAPSPAAPAPAPSLGRQTSMERPTAFSLEPEGQPTYKGRVIGDMSARIFGTKVKPSRHDPYGHKRIGGQQGLYPTPIIKFKQTGGPEDPISFGLAENEAKFLNLQLAQGMHPMQKKQLMDETKAQHMKLMVRRGDEAKEREEKDIGLTDKFHKVFLQISKQVDPSTGQPVTPEYAAEMAKNMMPEPFRERMFGGDEQKRNRWARGMKGATGMSQAEQYQRDERTKEWEWRKNREQTRQFEVDRAFGAREEEVKKQWRVREEQYGESKTAAEKNQHLNLIRQGLDMYWRMAQDEGVGPVHAKRFIESWEQQAGVSIFPEGWKHPGMSPEAGKKDMSPQQQEGRAGDIGKVIANYERARDGGVSDQFLAADAAIRTINGQFLDYAPGTTRWKQPDIQNTVQKVRDVVSQMGRGAMKVSLETVYEDTDYIRKQIFLNGNSRVGHSPPIEQSFLLQQIMSRIQREMREGTKSRVSQWRKLLKDYSESLPGNIRYSKPHELYQQQLMEAQGEAV